MKLSLERAKQVIEAFGPCTSLYECSTPEKLVEHVESRWAAPVQDENELASNLISCEEIRLERAREMESMRDGVCAPGYMEGIREEHDRLLAGVKERLKAIGIEVA